MISEHFELAMLIKLLSLSGSLEQGLERSDSRSQKHTPSTGLQNLPYARFLAEWILKHPMQEMSQQEGPKGLSHMLTEKLSHRPELKPANVQATEH